MTTVAHVVLVSNPENADPTSKFGSSHQLDSHFNCQHKLENGILGSPAMPGEMQRESRHRDRWNEGNQPNPWICWGSFADGLKHNPVIPKLGWIWIAKPPKGEVQA